MTFLDPRFWLAAFLVLAATFGTGFWRGDVHRRGVDQAEQQKQELAAADQRREDAKMQRQASAGYQTTLATIQGRAAGLQKELRNALSTPVPSCPGLALADVRLPAAAIGVLRDAGADPAP